MLYRYALDDATRIERHVQKTSKAFRALYKQVAPIYDLALGDFPERGELKQRGNRFVKYLKDDAQVIGFLDQYIGRLNVHQAASSWRGRTLYAIRDAYLRVSTLSEAVSTVEKIAAKSFVAIEMHKDQAPLKKALPDDLLPFLPKHLIVEVDKEGFIQKVTDRFENERLTLAVKIQRQKQIVRQYNEIVVRVKKDLKSGDEITRLAALVTAIVMETGIRPGKAGNAAMKKVNGEKIEVETFGAITLTADHVRFVRNEFAELEFVGKKGGVNLARVSDRDILIALQDYVDKSLSKGSKFVFVTEDGVRFTYKDLQQYFREHFKGLSPTDFRKLRATQTVLEKLNEEQKSLYQRIRKLVDEEAENLTQRVVAEIVSSLEIAYEHAREALSHDSVTTTIQAYVNPEVILRFLSEGQTQATLKSAILDGKPTLSFNPQTFIDKAKGKRASGLSLGDVLEALEDDLREEGIRIKMALELAETYTS